MKDRPHDEGDAVEAPFGGMDVAISGAPRLSVEVLNGIVHGTVWICLCNMIAFYY